MKIFAIAALALLATPALAQETTAGGNLGQQANWSSLQNQLNATNSKLDIVGTDVQQIKTCANQGKLWKAGTGCVNAIVTIDNSVYDKLVACGDKGMVYDKSANTCVGTGDNRWVKYKDYGSSVEKKESRARDDLVSKMASAGISAVCPSSMDIGRKCSTMGDTCYGAIAYKGVDCTNMGGDRGEDVCFSWKATATAYQCN